MQMADKGEKLLNAIYHAIEAAYVRGVEWNEENPLDREYRFKAARDFADKAFHDPDNELCKALARSSSTSTGESDPALIEKEDTEIVSRNEMAGYTEFVTADVPFLVETRHAGVDILRDLDTRQVIGYRVYDIEEGWARSPSTSTGESDWVVVPLEPTAEMLTAASAAEDQATEPPKGYSVNDIYRATWRAMLASAPAPQAHCKHCGGRGYVSGDPEGAPIEGCDMCGGTGAAPAPDTKQEPVAVKPLEWRRYRNGDADAVTTFGVVYSAYATGYWRTNQNPKFKKGGDGLDEAKAAAQADYEARIRSALFPSPVTQKVSEAAPSAVVEALRNTTQWLNAALNCKEWHWDWDQRVVASADLDAAEAVLALQAGEE